MPIGESSKARRKSCSVARSASSTRRASVTSWQVPCTATAWPASSTATSPRACTRRTSPSGRRMRWSMLQARAVGDGGLDRAGDAGAIVGVHALQVPRPALRGRLRAQAVDAVELVGPRHAVGLDEPLPAAQARDLLRLGELRLVGGERVLRGDARGDVEELDEVVERLAGGVAHERAADERDDGAPVAGAQPRLELERAGRAVARRSSDEPALAGLRALGELQGARSRAAPPRCGRASRQSASLTRLKRPSGRMIAMPVGASRNASPSRSASAASRPVMSRATMWHRPAPWSTTARTSAQRTSPPGRTMRRRSSSSRRWPSGLDRPGRPSGRGRRRRGGRRPTGSR